MMKSYMSWSAPVNVEKVHKQTVEEYLRDGGKITKCPSKRAAQVMEGALVIDGETFSVIPSGTEAVPQMNRVSLAQYDMGMQEAIQPYHHLAWRDIERESAPSVVRKQWDGRWAEPDEIDMVEYDR